jgi:hypothetical protein
LPSACSCRSACLHPLAHAQCQALRPDAQVVFRKLDFPSVFRFISEKLKPHTHVGLGLILYHRHCFKICALTSIYYNMPPQIMVNCMCQSIYFCKI